MNLFKKLFEILEIAVSLSICIWLKVFKNDEVDNETWLIFKYVLVFSIIFVYKLKPYVCLELLNLLNSDYVTVVNFFN